MDVLALLERVAQLWHIGDMRGQAQFDLAVIGGQQHIPRLGHERLADLPPDGGADGDVLQVGIGRGQPPGLRAHQAIAGMHAPRLVVDLRLQRIGIGGFQLGQLAPFQHLAGHLHALRIQFFQHALIGAVLAGLALLAAFVAHLVEQDIAQLLGAADGKLLARQRVDLRLQHLHLLGELARQAAERLAVHLDAAAFHARHHGHQRAVHPLIDLRHAFGWHAQLEVMPQAQRHIRVLGGIFGGIFQRDLVKADRLLAGAGERFVADRLMIQMRLGQRIHAVPAAHFLACI